MDSGTVVFVTIALLLAAVLIWLGKRLYDAGSMSSDAFYGKLGDLTLQLAVVVVVGALLKAVIDWGTAQRARQRERLETRIDFLRRVRAMHVRVRYAQALLNAHRSAKTYGEQLRGLMELRPEVEEISEDLKSTSVNTFGDRDGIREGLEGIIAYLEQGEKEYINCHAKVDAGYKAGQSLDATLKSEPMKWVMDFMASGPRFTESYVKNLEKAKGTMRVEVYGE